MSRNPSPFDFSRIPDYIREGYDDPGPSYRGKSFVDGELTDLATEAPPVAGEGAAL